MLSNNTNTFDTYQDIFVVVRSSPTEIVVLGRGGKTGIWTNNRKFGTPQSIQHSFCHVTGRRTNDT